MNYLWSVGKMSLDAVFPKVTKPSGPTTFQEEQHFVSQLQQKLRCAVRSLKAMVPLVSLGDAQLVPGTSNRKQLVGGKKWPLQK